MSCHQGEAASSCSDPVISSPHETYAALAYTSPRMLGSTVACQTSLPLAPLGQPNSGRFSEMLGQGQRLHRRRCGRFRTAVTERASVALMCKMTRIEGARVATMLRNRVRRGSSFVRVQLVRLGGFRRRNGT